MLLKQSTQAVMYTEASPSEEGNWHAIAQQHYNTTLHRQTTCMYTVPLQVFVAQRTDV